MKGVENMLEIETAGGKPINRPKSWEEDQRQRKKETKKKNWFWNGDFDVLLFVPHTPGGQLAKLMR